MGRVVETVNGKMELVHGMNVYQVRDDRMPGGVRTVVDQHQDDEVEPSLTQQQFKDDCDVNLIMERNAKVGVTYGNMPDAIGTYADLTGLGDYRDMLERVKLAQDAFDQMPAKVKARFEQDPAKLIAFLESNSQEDIDESYRLGLRVKAAPPPPNETVEAIKAMHKDLKPKKTKTIVVDDE